MISRRDLLTTGSALAASSLIGSAGAQAQATLVRKAIPSSGEMIPVIGLGTARRYEDVKGEQDMPPLRETLKAFKASGLTVIDSSPSYGTAEAVVGQILEEQKSRQGLFLATKVSIMGREAGINQIEQSFKKLRTDKIDLLAVHNLRDLDVHLKTLRDMKQQGRIRYIGVTTSFDNQYADFEAMMKRETLDFIQIDYALDNRNADDRILPLAKDRGMAVMVNLPFGRGRLFSAVQGKPLPDWASEFDCKSWAQFFLKYIVSHPSVVCTMPGMARPDYVADNAGAAQGRMPDAALRKKMEQFIDGL
jgi:aryl-alcohol dehydrogenase-like predicted oxidoreductase